MKFLADLKTKILGTLDSIRHARGALWKLRATPVVQISFWAAATVIGAGAVLYARLIAVAQSLFFSQFHAHPDIVAVSMPLLFLLAAWLVVRFAPHASGSGIPQVLTAISTSRRDDHELQSSGLVSVRTAVVKMFSTLVGVLGGASIGREGPTVQLSATAFALIGRVTRRYVPQISMQSYLIAGAAGGIAAAFNTPIAGVTFALEEIAEDVFGQFKQFVMITVIVAGISAQAFAGDYLYFGRPTTARLTLAVAPVVLAIGLVGGLGGGLFARLLAFPLFQFHKRLWWQRALLSGAICGLLAWLTSGATAGSGYEITREFMEGRTETLPDYFAPAKLLATVLSYLSGMAGGIFAPCLSIGAGLGALLGQLAGHEHLRSCALFGMAAFFTGAVQAPLTAIIIVTEMTDEHVLILPLMAAALIANASSKWIMPTPLYRYLSQRGEAKKEEQNTTAVVPSER